MIASGRGADAGTPPSDNDLNRPSRCVETGAAAQLLEPLIDSTRNFVGAISPEQHHRARLLGRIQRHDLGLSRSTGQILVDDFPDLADFLGRHRPGRTKSKRALVGTDQRAF